MRGYRGGRLWLLGLVLLAAGCGVAVQALPPNSRFAQDGDLRRPLIRAGAEHPIETQEYGSGTGAGGGRISHNVNFWVRGSAEETDKWMRALRQEFVNDVEAYGAEVEDPAAPSGGGRMDSFVIHYRQGQAQGTITAKLTATKGAFPYSLELKMEDVVKR